METKAKLKMSNKKFRTILIVVMAILTVLCLIVNIAANVMAATIDTYLGAGEKYISTPNDVNNLDANYYKTSYANNNESKEAAYQVARRVAEEGSVLLKNNGILPMADGSTVTPFGYAYLNPIYGQLTSGGSAKWVIDPVTPEQGLSAFNIDTSAADLMKAAGDPEKIIEAPGTREAGTAGSILGGDCVIYEYNPSIYDGMSAASGSVGIVFITRSGQEGQDQKFDAYADGTPHYLAFSENEKGAVKAAKAACGKVIIVLVSSAPMELGDYMTGDLEADAILWMGHPGERGFSVLSDLLDGKVNPSGRTVDTYVADLTKDPAYCTLGEFTYSNYNVTKEGYMPGSAAQQPGMFTEYQDGMYMGYRYYETAAEVDPSFVYGELDGKGAFVTEGAVCYPFGYGLSYTTFEQKLLSVSRDGDKITASVEVTNTGSRAGKEVVQLYYTAPYTDLDKQNKIEKPVVSLIAFDKTKELAPGESETLELSFTTDDMTSYCYTHDNGNGTVGCYMLEKGDYIISLRKNSHDVIDEKTITQKETIWYDGSDDNHIRQTEKDAQSAMDESGNILGTPADPDAGWVAATNQFQTSSDYMNTDSTIFSRSDWNGTFPKMESKTKEISQQFIDKLGIESSFNVETDPLYGNV